MLGGITNRNYLVRDLDRSVVVRFGEDLPHLGVYRRNETLCHRSAERLGIAPRLLHAADGVMATEFIAGRTMNAEGIRAEGFPARLAQALKTLHAGSDMLSGEYHYFCIFQTCRTHTDVSRNLGAPLPHDIDALLAALLSLSRTVAPFVPTLCHNDMLPGNVLDDGEKVWIIDWEYAGMGNPLFDLAGVSVNCEFSPEQDRDFLTSYRDEFRPRDLADLEALKAASLLREALWSVVQIVASDLDFDYRNHAEVHFERFRATTR